MFNSFSLPSRAWLNQAVCFHTPDIMDLEDSEFKLLFVADNMKRGLSAYEQIAEHSAYISRAFSMTDFQFFIQRSNGLPIPMEASQEFCPVAFPVGKLYGELHAIESKRFKELDNYRGNTVQFLRKRVRVLVPHRAVQIAENLDINGKRLPPALLGKKGLLYPERIHLIKAYLYVGNPDYWNDLIDGGYLFTALHTLNPLKEKRWLRKFFKYKE